MSMDIQRHFQIIFQLYGDGQSCWWSKPEKTNHQPTEINLIAISHFPIIDMAAV